MKFGEKIKKFFTGKTAVNEALYDDLCDLLIEGDFGAAQGYKTVELLKARTKNSTAENIPQELCILLTEELKRITPAGARIDDQDELAAVLLLGVNGVGKTTTAAKLASLYNVKFNKKSILAAGDTFRAAAIDQLKIHGERLNEISNMVRVVAHKQGGDPAAVVFDALEAAVSGGADVVIADTAGRMHTKNALVEELRKIDRVVESKLNGS
ncbi:MAG: AAA family ATPase, partial [Treponema sp.]|nr:AAA family ATPase [Treponema sp.]